MSMQPRRALQSRWPDSSRKEWSAVFGRMGIAFRVVDQHDPFVPSGQHMASAVLGIMWTGFPAASNLRWVVTAVAFSFFGMP